VLDLTQWVLLQASRIFLLDFWSFKDVYIKLFRQDQHQLWISGGWGSIYSGRARIRYGISLEEQLAGE